MIVSGSLALLRYKSIILVCGYRPTTHHKCKEEPYKNIGGRQHPLTNVQAGVQPKRISKRLPSKLGAALLQSPDAIYKLIKHKRKETLSPSHSHRPSRSSFHDYSGHIIRQPFRRQSKRATYSHLSRLSTRSTTYARRWTSSSTTTQIASPIGINQQNMVINDHPLRKGSKSMALESVMAKWGSPKGSMEVKTRANIQESGGPIPPHCGVSHSRQHSKSWPFLKEMDEIGDNSCIETPRSSMIQLYVKKDGDDTRQQRKQKYTLRSFLKECEKKEQTQKQLEFLGKGHHLWQMGVMGEGIMLAVVGEKDAYYKQQFHNWAQYVINREKNLLSFDVIANTTINAPSFIPGLASEAVMKLQQGKLQKHVDQQGKPSKLSHSNKVK